MAKADRDETPSPTGEPTRAEAARLRRLREIALALPETTEVEAWGHPTFRVRNKMFATCGNDAGNVNFKADPDEREGLLGDEERFFVPAYAGRFGWVGLRLEGVVDWDEVTELVTTSFCLVAPKRVARQVRQPGDGRT
jgi:predicted DNA-binding protein (MmcQ/YjbR family)